MAEVVFILGAGASREGGAPLMADFLDIADNLWRTDRVSRKEEFFKSVFQVRGRMQALHSKAQLDLNNIESVFNAFVMAGILNKFPETSGVSGVAAVEALKHLIATTLEQTLLFPARGNRLVAPKPYGAFADLLNYLRREAHPQQTVAVLTFNYDMAADLAMFQARLGPNYCLESASGGAVPLLKLHGSMNWGVCSKCGAVIPWHLDDFFKQFRIDYEDGRDGLFEIWSQFDQFVHCGTKVEPLPFLVPPTWNKTDHFEAIRVVWERAAKELTDAEHIFIIGYSLPETDAFFRMLYALGVVGEMPLKRIWVYNPDATGAVERRFRELIGPGAEARFLYLPQKFDFAIGDIKHAFPARKR